MVCAKSDGLVFDFETDSLKLGIKDGYIHANVDGRLKGAHIIFPGVSVGATCNMLMAAVLAEGEAADREDIIYLEKLPVFPK